MSSNRNKETSGPSLPSVGSLPSSSNLLDRLSADSLSSRPRLDGSVWEIPPDVRYSRALSFWISMSTRLSGSLTSNPAQYNETLQMVTESQSGERVTYSESYNYLSYALEDLFNFFIGEVDSVLASSEISLYRRKTVFRLPRLNRLIEFGLVHIQECFKVQDFLDRQQIETFLQHPTRMFVLIELSYILEAIPHHRDFLKTLSLLKSHSVALHQAQQFSGPYISIRHPFTQISLGNYFHIHSILKMTLMLIIIMS